IPGATYQWISPSNSPDGYFGDLSEPGNVVWTSTASTSISSDNSIWYTTGEWRVQTLSADGCVSAPSAPVFVDIMQAPATTTASNSGDICAGGIVQLYAATVPGANYRWYDGDPAASPAGTLIAVTQNPMLTGLEIGTHSFFVETVIGDCSSLGYGQTEVIVTEQPFLDEVENTGPYCIGSTIELQAPFIAGATYHWSGPASFESNLQNPSIENAQVFNSGVYSLYVELNDCTSAILSTNVVVMESHEQPVISSNSPVCLGDEIQLIAPTYSVGTQVTYHWTGPNGFSSEEAQPIVPSADTTHAGAYTLTLVFGSCDSIVSLPEEVEVIAVPPVPQVLNSTSIDSPACVGDELILSSPLISGLDYYWTGPNGFSSNASELLLTQVTLDQAGTYTLYLSAGSCISEIVTTQVYIMEAPEVPIALSNSPLCEGEDLVLSVSNDMQGLTYEWFDSIGNVSIGQGASLIIESVASANAGTYYVVASQGACASDPSATTAAGEDAFVQVVIESPTADIAWLGDAIYTCEDTLTLEAIPLQDGAGVWSWAEPTSTAVIHYPESEQTFVSGLLPGDNYILWTVYSPVCGYGSSDTLLIEWAEDAPIAVDDEYEVAYGENIMNLDFLKNDAPNTAAYTIEIITYPQSGQIYQQADGLYLYEPEAAFAGEVSIDYRICHMYCPDKCDDAQVTFKVGRDAPCAVPSVITPNGDGLNDQFIIPCLPNNQGSKLSIFNRWGSEVYFSENYQNDWEGTFENSNLPSGTYYYIIWLNDGLGTKLTGYVFIER
ncbi:MAG TPA: gliding motility-associated C-terminal domain-containing protein, partial [Phaeodactylibacter sp.]|nr:gliding motility-associated C-terminal domain-containing protein [Phaeodactylibacter sp.]